MLVLLVLVLLLLLLLLLIMPTLSPSSTGLFSIVDLKTGRFDATEAYAKLDNPPLSWELLLKRTELPL